MSGAVLEARAVIRGDDQTKAAFDSIRERINKLIGQIGAIDRVMGRMDQIARPINLATEEMRKFETAAESMRLIDKQATAIARSFAETAQSIDKATAAAAKFGRVNVESSAGHGAASGGRGHGGHSRFETLREVAGGVAPLVGMGIAFEGAEAVRGAVKGGFERQHERVRMMTSGMTPGDIADTERLSADLSSRYAPVGQTEIMHLMRNARSVVGSYDEASKLLQPLLDLRVVAQGAHPGQNMEEDFDQLIKGMEIKGVTQDPTKFRSYINSMGKAINAFGDTLRPTDFYEMFKYGRQSTSGFSQDYMMTVAPTLAQEMKGSSAGVANSAFFRAVVGGRMEKVALARMEELGLVDKSKLFTPPGGHLVSAAGAIQGWQLAQLNPYEWVNKVLLPAMQKKGIVDPQKIQEVINSIFSNQVAAQMVGIYATQQARIDKDRGVIAHTMDTPEAARAIMEKDPVIAAEGLKNALENLGTVFADKTLHLASVMTTVAEGINRFSAQLQHAYEKPASPDAPPSSGQARANGWFNDAVSWWAGTPRTHSKGGYNEGRRASLIALADQSDGAADSVDYDAYENARNGGRLLHDAIALIPRMPSFQTPAELYQKADNTGRLRQRAKAGTATARAMREFRRKAGQLQDLDDKLNDYDNSAWRRSIVQSVPTDLGHSSFGLFPMSGGMSPSPGLPPGRSYADLPMPSDLPWNPGHGAAPATPEGAEDHHDTAEAIKAALSASTFMAQLDPNSKASVELTVKFEPSSDLVKAVADAKIAASGSLAAKGTSGSRGVSYTETGPTGRSGGMGPN